MVVRIAVLSALCSLGIWLPGAARAADPALTGTVGPGFNISLVDANGNLVTHLDPGTYTITVKDQSDLHSFDLRGPGVSQQTDIDFVGTVSWTVTFTDGIYDYRCDAHPTLMHKRFAVGTATLPTPKPKPTVKKLVGSVGPTSISLRSASGSRVGSVKNGIYKITVHDRTSTGNFHLIGPGGVNKKTGVGARGTVTWTVHLRKGTYRFQSDPQRARLHGRLRVT